MAADIPQGGGAKNRIGDCMQQHVGVGMAEQTQVMRNLHAADDQVAVFHQCVAVVTLADAEGKDGSRHDGLQKEWSKYSSAACISRGKVTFRLRGCPSMSFGDKPSAS